MNFNDFILTGKLLGETISSKHIGKYVYSERFAYDDDEDNPVGCKIIFKITGIFDDENFSIEPILEDESLMDDFLMEEGLDCWRRSYREWLVAVVKKREVLFEL